MLHILHKKVRNQDAWDHKSSKSKGLEQEKRPIAAFVPLAHTQTVAENMFDFEKLEVYKKAKEFNKTVATFLKEKNLDRVTNDQLRRASFSIMLNIAEGSGRYSKADKRNFYVISRGPTFECVAIIDYLLDSILIDKKQIDVLYKDLEEISKMLFSLIKKLS